MPKEDGKSDLSTDEEFACALDVSLRLHEAGHFEVRPTVVSGVEITVENDRAREALDRTDLTLERYREIVDHELDVLLTSQVLGMSQAALLEAPGFEDLEEEEQNTVIARAGEVGRRFPVNRIAAEHRARRSAVIPPFWYLDWQLVKPGRSGDTAPTTAAAVVRFCAEVAARPTSGNWVADLISRRAPDDLAVTCTLTDLDHMLRRLRLIREELRRAEGEE